jgi:hypothetical protein
MLCPGMIVDTKVGSYHGRILTRIIAEHLQFVVVGSEKMSTQFGSDITCRACDKDRPASGHGTAS